MTLTQISCQNTQPYIHNENMHIEILLVMHTYSIMTLTTKTYSQSRTNTQHYYNKNYKTHTGIYPIMTKSYQISKDMDVETMPHAMYFTGDPNTAIKINQVPYQTIEYNDNGMFTAKLMNDTPIEIFIDNGATPSILPLRTYNKFPILHTYPKTKSNTPIHTGGGLITSHFWLKIPLKLQHQTIQIKALVCDSECPYYLILGKTSMAQLSAWQDYMTNKLYIQQISIPLTVRNNIWILPGKTGIVTLTLRPNKTSLYLDIQ